MQHPKRPALPSVRVRATHKASTHNTIHEPAKAAHGGYSDTHSLKIHTTVRTLAPFTSRALICSAVALVITLSAISGRTLLTYAAVATVSLVCAAVAYFTHKEVRKKDVSSTHSRVDNCTPKMPPPYNSSDVGGATTTGVQRRVSSSGGASNNFSSASQLYPTAHDSACGAPSQRPAPAPRPTVPARFVVYIYIILVGDICTLGCV